MSGVAVRPATTADAAGIAHVHVESWRAAYAGIVPQAFLDAMSEERRTGQWAEILAGGSWDTWVALDDAGVIGFASTSEPEAADEADVAPGAKELSTIYVLREAWDTGAGRALMDAVVSHHADQQTPELILWVFEANDRARRFYERAGWMPDETSRDLAIGGAELPTVRYRRALDPADEVST